MRGWRTIYHATGSQKKAGVAILISDKLDFKLKAVTRDEEGHYIIVTGSIHQEELTIINVYAPNTGAPKYIKQLLINISNLIDKNVVIAGDFNTPLTEMDRSSRHTVNKETRALNETLDQMDLTDIFRMLHPKATEYTFFLSAHGTKINSKWIKDLNVRQETIKTLEEKAGKDLSDLSRSNLLLDTSPKAMELKAKMNYWGLMKIKSSASQRKQPTKLKGNQRNGKRYLQMTYRTKG